MKTCLKTNIRNWRRTRNLLAAAESLCFFFLLNVIQYQQLIFFWRFCCLIWGYCEVTETKTWSLEYRFYILLTFHQCMSRCCNHINWCNHSCLMMLNQKKSRKALKTCFCCFCCLALLSLFLRELLLRMAASKSQHVGSLWLNGLYKAH